MNDVQLALHYAGQRDVRIDRAVYGSLIILLMCGKDPIQIIILIAILNWIILMNAAV